MDVLRKSNSAGPAFIQLFGMCVAVASPSASLRPLVFAGSGESLAIAMVGEGSR